MVPGVGLNGCALHVLSQVDHGSIEKLLHGHYDNQDNQSEWRWRMVRQKNLAHTLDGETKRSRQHP